MTAATDEFVQVTQRSQEAVTAAVRSWSETLQNYAGSFITANPLPGTTDTLAAVDAWFDLATRLLAEQRTVATVAITRGHEALSTVTAQAGTLGAAFADKLVPATTAPTAHSGRNGSARTD
jgi:hypothetical protein